MSDTQLTLAQKGIVTPQMRAIAAEEGVPVEDLMARVAKGKVVIPANKNRSLKRPVGIGEGLKVKVNANIGTSSDHADVEEELAKLKAALEAGADAIMDLSTDGDLDSIRRKLIRETPVPFGTVPIYQAAIEIVQQKGGIIKMTPEDIFAVIEKQAQDGVDFMTVHCGVTLQSLERLKKQGRVTNIVSRGGAFLTTWMLYHEKENPLYEYYDRLLEIARKHDITLSLGDGLRPGSLPDATDRAQIQELIFLGELTERAWDAGVQVMIEGPGHVPLNQIEANVLLEKKLCKGAPFYVLGPLVTDIASGYDHIAAAIGGALAAWAGADFLCYVTPAEHLRLPTVEDVREGVIGVKIAAHAADLARGNPKAWEKDREMAKARGELDWDTQIKLSINPEKAKYYRSTSSPKVTDVCTMCGKYCAIKLVKEYLSQKDS
ncbi:MAG: phosphomethylpyrimidine synthase ThiC [Candidatus Desulfofervidaceae bacterium]|nr:phosphomethylpyrimidine synthase ThiC [Candidatus Desulfofervidaceae bacterium]